MAAQSVCTCPPWGERTSNASRACPRRIAEITGQALPNNHTPARYANKTCHTVHRLKARSPKARRATTHRDVGIRDHNQQKTHGTPWRKTGEGAYGDNRALEVHTRDAVPTKKPPRNTGVKSTANFCVPKLRALEVHNKVRIIKRDAVSTKKPARNTGVKSTANFCVPKLRAHKARRPTTRYDVEVQDQTQTATRNVARQASISEGGAPTTLVHQRSTKMLPGFSLQAHQPTRAPPGRAARRHRLEHTRI